MSANDNSILEVFQNDNSPHSSMMQSSGVRSLEGTGIGNRRAHFFESVDEQAENDFLKRILDNTVHGTCQVPGMCHGSIEDQLDMFMTCRQPLSMFSFFRDDQAREAVRVQVLPGAYVLPTFCEYCKAPNRSSCPTHCERPKLYFQKKRPPFRKLDPNYWNPQNDFALNKEEMGADDDDDDSLPDSPDTTCKEVASLASTSGSSSNSTTNNRPKYSPTDFPDLNESSESYDSMPRHNWLFSSRAQQEVTN
ncbi:hypothetical protein ACA910_022115 [Epithemia clementina (nom. ined.)]